MRSGSTILVGLLAGSLHPQAPVGGPIPARTLASPTDKDARREMDTRLADARRAIAREERRLARRHLAAALSWAPASAEVLRFALEAAGKEERAIWAQRWWLATMDAKGRGKPDRTTSKLLPAGPLHPGELALARVAALREVARFVAKRNGNGKRGRGDGVLVRWAQEIAHELVRRSPALHREFGPRFQDAVTAQRADYKTVLQALRKLMAAPAPQQKGPATATAEPLALRAARCLTGLGAQAAFKKLAGPKPPDMSSLRDAARAARAKLRGRIAAEAGEPWTVEKLAALDEKAREAFNLAHASWNRPARGVSPSGLYLVETTCGHRSLLGALQTIEMHHRRLANWYGKDPFQKRQGLVRILPEASGLESEDSPFWWAGGFQRGDLTVLRFSWGTIAGLGRGLTHELTHRFDGVLRPFLPPWLVEGRAVWTGKSYGAAEDEHFLERALDPYTVQAAFIKGYGGRRDFEKLLAGTIDDYRDNYTAGYALFAFLRTWTIDGKPVFARRLEQYLRRARLGRKKPVAFFLDHFADGKHGRPDGIDAFLEAFHAFLRGCYRHCWRETVPWIDRYETRRPGGRRNALIEDEPTWSWARNRAEPWFGDVHAAAAGDVLRDAGDIDAAIAAYLWSLETDGWRRGVGRELARLCDKAGKRDVAWVVRYETERRRLSASQRASAAPMLARLPRLRAFVRLERRHADACREKGERISGAAFDAAANRLASRLGLPRVAVAAGDMSLALLDATEEPRRVSLSGLVEDGLTGYEERRVEGLWFESSQGDLHVGRRKPRNQTGVLDRTAHQRHAFVRSVEWQQPGAYVLHTRVNFTTSFVSGAVILGWTRRDRNVRIHFSAGDFLYAIGRKDDPGRTKSVSLSLQGLWDRESPLRTRSHRRHEFEHPVASFELELRVFGPSVHVVVQGQHVLSYTTPDLSPIEGAIGFAMGQGAVRFRQPTVQRLDRGCLSQPTGFVGLDLGGQSPASVAAMLGRPTRGLPRGEHGTIVVLLPRKPSEEWAGRGFDVAMQRLGPLLDDPLHCPQTWAVAVPRGLDLAVQRDLRKRTRGRRMVWLEHAIDKPFEKGPWLLFVDADGVLRVAEAVRRKKGFSGALRRWARYYRSR